MEFGGRKRTQRMRLGRDGVWWEKGNTENEVGDRGMESGGRKGTKRMRLGRDGVWWEKGTQNEVE